MLGSPVWSAAWGSPSHPVWVTVALGTSSSILPRSWCHMGLCHVLGRDARGRAQHGASVYITPRAGSGDKSWQGMGRWRRAGAGRAAALAGSSRCTPGCLPRCLGTARSPLTYAVRRRAVLPSGCLWLRAGERWARAEAQVRMLGSCTAHGPPVPCSIVMREQFLPEPRWDAGVVRGTFNEESKCEHGTGKLSSTRGWSILPGTPEDPGVSLITALVPKQPSRTSCGCCPSPAALGSSRPSVLTAARRKQLFAKRQSLAEGSRAVPWPVPRRGTSPC